MQERPLSETPPTLQGLSVDEFVATIPGAFFWMDRDFRFVLVNAAAEALLQATADQLLGRTMWEIFPEAIGTAFEDRYRRAMAGETMEFIDLYVPLDRWFEVQAVPHASGLGVWFHDVSAFKQAEHRAERQAEVRAALGTVATAVASGAGSETIYEQVCEQARKLVEAPAAWVVRFTGDEYEVVERASRRRCPGSPSPATACRSRRAAPTPP